ncbi:MAG: thioredoxin-dependent thiol peroxidase [Chloroflexota bacterium]
MDELHEGDEAPDFTLPYPGGELTLRDMRGRPVVVYFYPKDDTSGCTTEACGFQSVYPRLAQAGAEVLGVSRDSLDSHNQFAAKFGLTFPLLSDPDHRVAEAYGAWTQRQSYGKTYMGIERSTFLIDPDGKIQKIWREVTPKGHAEQVLAEIQ